MPKKKVTHGLSLWIPFWLLGVIHYSPIKIIHYLLEYSLNTCYMLKLGTILVHWFINFIWMLISPRNPPPYICTIVKTKRHCVLFQRRFFLSILGCTSHIGHCPQEELTNFGYSLKENINFKEFCYIWMTWLWHPMQINLHI